jgi:glycerophosphoryl diester phosphodiesterase
MKKPLITAHTGCNNTPRNTVSSVLAGVDWGADINEIDVRTTSDHIPLLWHDDVLKTHHCGTKQIKDLNYKEIRDLSDKGEIVFDHPLGKITSLEEMLDATSDKSIVLNLDLKDDDCIVPAAGLIRQRDLARKIIFSGCEKVRASYIKSNYPEFQVLLNAEESLFLRDDISYSEKIRILCDTAVSAGCCGLNIRYDLCSQELIDYADLRFLPVAVWTVSSDDGFGSYIDMGVSSITTLNVKELAEFKNS